MNTPHPSEPDRRTPEPKYVTNREALQLAMQSMVGHASFAYLGDIHESAQRRFGFSGSLEDALHLLSGMTQIEIHPQEELAQYEVSCPLYDTFSIDPTQGKEPFLE